MYSGAEPSPVISIDLNSPAPAYRQIVDQIRHLLVEDSLRPGDALPSVRRLAMDLGVHHNTVAEAYRSLAEEGWLEVTQGKPVRVLQRAQSPARNKQERAELQEGYARRLRHLVAEMKASGVSRDWISKLLRSISEE